MDILMFLLTALSTISDAIAVYDLGKKVYYFLKSKFKRKGNEIP